MAVPPFAFQKGLPSLLVLLRTTLVLVFVLLRFRVFLVAKGGLAVARHSHSAKSRFDGLDFVFTLLVAITPFLVAVPKLQLL